MIDAVSRATDVGLYDIAWARRCPPLAAARADPRWAPLQAIIEDRACKVSAAIDAG